MLKNVQAIHCLLLKPVITDSLATLGQRKQAETQHQHTDFYIQQTHSSGVLFYESKSQFGSLPTPERNIWFTRVLHTQPTPNRSKVSPSAVTGIISPNLHLYLQ